MKQFNLKTKSVKSLFLLLALLLGGTSPTWADGKALPYSYGFEDYNLATDGWTKYFGTSLTSNNNECAIVGDAKKTGSYGFRFSSYNTNGANAQYLISPEFNAPNGLIVSFEYKASSSSTSGELFKVGYSTNGTDIADFTFGDEFSTKSTSWQTYEGSFPAGTKYIAVYYYANYQYRLYVDDFTFSTPPTCIKPTGLATSDLTSSSVALSWTSDADTWNVQYKKAADTDWTDVGGNLTSKSYTITGLQPATAYQARVRTYCDSQDQSEWTETVGFTTDCATVTEFPFSENFNSLTSGIPMCWNNSDGTTTNSAHKWNYNTGGHESTTCVMFNSYTNISGNTNMLKTPVMNFPDGKIMQLSFWHKNNNTGDFSVYISNDGGSTYTTALAEGLSASTWTQKEIILPNGFTENVVVVFKGTSNYGSNNIFLDDIVVSEAPACIKPADLVANDITKNGATLSWTAGSDETKWDLCYGTVNDPDDADNTIVSVETTPSKALTGLTAETVYYAFVRSVKGDDHSDWSTGISFEPTATVTLTVNEGTATNAYVPVYGNYVDQYDKVEFIIPATSIADMDGGTIKGLTFYLSNPATNSWGSANFKVYMKEVDNTTISEFSFSESETPLYNGSLDGTQSTMTVTLTNSYKYNGGNLLVGIYNTEKGSYKSASFYGVSAENGASVYGNNSTSLASVTNVNKQSFLPKTTFRYLESPMTTDFKAVAFGKITPASTADDKKITVTVTNKKADEALAGLSVSLEESTGTSGVFSLSDGIATSIAANGTTTFDILMNTTTSGTYGATVTISATGADNIVIPVTGEYAAAPATIAVKLGEEAVGATVAFGTVNKQTVKTFSVSNSGDLPLNITSITSDNTTDFTVSPATLTVAGGETENFTVTFLFDEEALDAEKTANITITPSNAGLDQVVFAVTGTRIEMWSEDFDGVNPLATWTNSGWTVGTYNDDSENTTKKLISASSKNAIISPKFEATETNKTLTFDACYKYADEGVTIAWSTNKDDAESWIDITTYKPEDDGASGFGIINYHKSMSVTAPTTSEAFYLRFTPTYGSNSVIFDNFEGFKLKAAAEHEAEVISQTIPTTGNQYVEYTASIDVKVTGTNDEQLTAKFFIGDTQYGESVVKNVASNATETFEVVFTPATDVSGDAYFTIESADIAAFESDKVAVTIAAATVLDEETAPTLAEGTLPSVVVKYTAKNGWNTICMPFVLTTDIMNSIFGTGWKAYEFKSYNGTELGFSTTTTFYAGYPYIVYVETAATHTDGVQLQNVAISKTSAQYDQYGGAYFRGTYAPVAAGEWTKNADSDIIYGVTSDGHIKKAGSGASIKGFRAYFDLPAGAAAPSISFEDTTTGITSLTPALSEGEGAVYNLNGQKVQNAQKGLYIVNGRKVVIK